MKKRLLAFVILILVISLSLASCDNSKPNDDNTENSETNELITAYTDNTSFNLQEMAYLFYGSVSNFYSQNSQYISYFGLDLSSDLKKQECSVSDDADTWFDYFLTGTKMTAEQFIVLVSAAKKDGMSIDESDMKQVDETIKQYKDYADEQGITLDEYFNAAFKNNVTEKNVRSIVQYMILAEKYYQKIMDGISLTDEEIEAYYHEQYPDDYRLVNVRHILVDDEEKANELLNEVNSAEDAEAVFSKLAEENSTDPGSSSNGGLYEGVPKGEMVESFNDWCFDESRKVGDTGIVKTDYGYHVMYFSGYGDYANAENAKTELENSRYNDEFEKLLAVFPVTFNDTELNKLEG